MWEVVVGSRADDRGRWSPPSSRVGKRTHRGNECPRKKYIYISKQNTINMSTSNNGNEMIQMYIERQMQPHGDARRR